MILLMIHLFTTSVHAQTAKVPPATYCTEVQPQVAYQEKENPHVPLAMSIVVSSSCGAGKPVDLTDLCTVTSQCTFMPDDGLAIAEKDFPGIPFDKLDSAQKNKVIYDIGQADVAHYKANPDPNFAPTLQWLPYSVVCNKVSYKNEDGSIYKSPAGNTRFCPVPDQCKFPATADNVKIEFGEFIPREVGAMRLRLVAGAPTIYSPSRETTVPAGKATNSP